MRHSKHLTFDIGRRRFGFEWSLVPIAGKPYLSRLILYFGLGTLRLHKFMRGDDDRAVHGHPWWFITFPTMGYWERVYVEDGWDSGYETQYVKPWRFHYRPSAYKHIVLGTHYGMHAHGGQKHFYTPKPFWTFVISGHRSRGWGFWPDGKPFVPWRNWK